MRNERILREKVTEKSVTDKPFEEWELDSLKLGDGEDECLCSKQGIVQLCFLKNKNTGEVILVGNECVKKFFGKDYSANFRDLKDKMEQEQRAEQNKDLLTKIEEKQKIVNSWEKEFLDTVKGIVLKGWTLSGRQQEIFDRIMGTGKKVDVSFLDKLEPENDWEVEFLKSVKEALSSGRNLSEKQNEILERIKERNKEEVQTTLAGKPQCNLNFSSLKYQPRDYQIDAYLKWCENNYIGSLELGTGTGKTLIGVMIRSQFPTEKMLVVVPTEALLEQWQQVFKEQLDLDVGVYYGKKKEMKDVTIAVINSVRDIDCLNFDILVLDEGHRYVSSENSGILRHKFKKMISLSATFKRDDKLHEELFEICPPIYYYGQKVAIEQGWLSKYKVLNIGTELTTDEDKQNYAEWSELIKQGIAAYGGPDGVIANLRDSFAQSVMRAMTRRRQLLLDNDSKVDKAIEIVRQEKFERAFIFNEYIKTAERMYKKLIEQGYKVGLYHSALKAKLKKEMLEKFRTGEYQAIVTVKALDEGIDVPTADLAIIVGRTSQARQNIQRLGRVLRISEGKAVAKVINIYVKNTADEAWLRKGFPKKGASEIKWK